MAVRPSYKFTIMLFLLKERIEKIVTKKGGKIVMCVRHIFYPLSFQFGRMVYGVLESKTQPTPLYHPSPF